MIKTKKKDILLTLFLLVFFTHVALAEITGSAHDLSGAGYGSNEICIFCHTPHNGVSEVDGKTYGVHLWNHEITSATYTLYNSPTLDATMEQPGGVSKLCLSCHDGTIAIDSFGGNSGTNYMSGSKAVGRNSDLSDDHPVGFRWEHQTNPECTTACHFGGPTGDPYSYEVRFYNHRMECSTCHDPHNNGPEGGSGDNPMLRMTMNGSALCLLCHNRK